MSKKSHSNEIINKVKTRLRETSCDIEVTLYTRETFLFLIFSPMDKHNYTPMYIAIAVSTIITIAANYFMIQKPKIDEV